MQPSKLTEIFQEDSFDDGLLPRHLPLSTENKPAKFSRDTVSDDSYSWYTGLLDSCYDKEIKFDENGCIEHVILKLDEEAVGTFEVFHKIREYEEFVSRRLSAFIPKLVSYCLRIAGVLHEIECYTNGKAETHISKKTITNAIEVTKFFAGQAVKVIKLYDETEASLNEYEKKLIGVLYKLQNLVKNGRLLLSKITETLNTELPEQLRITDNRIVGNMLRDRCKLSTKKKGGNYYLMWESEKIQKLFIKTSHVSPVSPTENKMVASI
ncbi:MAG: DUF3987 domain-containing protein [Candidatus Scalindua rubra]|uniref:Uncharacterized protein n=1 Tax=Candidatus Scalindua brodae TaxID=237368 RepID=A0A0B0ELY2_9BACT|nr:MAG: hypothetical protein SCABRO_00659 [Candidatus Scalindua brodae]MBZ0107862.1 DUF3987 domain-containing protein [Candidatus Scalindua rubra]TWU29174.1 hypothetical protein S225a_25480 [Candidatus Brocadiaceae bacterium S225]